MNVSLLRGSFSPKDLEKIITDLIQVKIEFHENQIGNSDEEETMKMRENRIIKLQNDLTRVRIYLKEAGPVVNVEAQIILSPANG